MTMHSLTVGHGDNYMFLFGRKRRERAARQEAEIKAIHSDTIERIDKASKTIEKYRLDKLLKDAGTTELIFYATGGDHRIRRKQR